MLCHAVLVHTWALTTYQGLEMICVNAQVLAAQFLGTVCYSPLLKLLLKDVVLCFSQMLL